MLLGCIFLFFFSSCFSFFPPLFFLVLLLDLHVFFLFNFFSFGVANSLCKHPLYNNDRVAIIYSSINYKHVITSVLK